jgi:hypothetical protein
LLPSVYDSNTTGEAEVVEAVGTALNAELRVTGSGFEPDPVVVLPLAAPSSHTTTNNPNPNTMTSIPSQFFLFAIVFSFTS